MAVNLAIQDLQSTYDRSVNGDILLDSGIGPVRIRDAATPLGTELLQVQTFAGANIMSVDVNSINAGSGVQILADAGSAGTPGLASGSATTTGLLWSGSELGVSVGGTEIWRFLSTGAFAAQGGTRLIQNVANPVSATDAVNLQTLNDRFDNFHEKPPAVVATLPGDGNITLSGLQTIDGISLSAGDRVLLTDQTAGSENGLWEAQTGAWNRPSDFDTGDSASAATISIQGGGTNTDNTRFQCFNDIGSDVIDTDSLDFQQIGGLSQVVAGDGLVKTGNTLDVVANADGSIIANANDIQVGVLATDAQHGNRGGGALHAVATTSVAGFMSAADKTTFDAHLNPINTSNPHSVSLEQARTINNTFAGPILGAFGTAGAPTYSFNTDADTGWYRSAVDTIGGALGGAQFLALSSSILDYGTRSNRTLEISNEPTGYGGINYLPDGRTRTITGTVTAALVCNSNITTNIPGGGGLGNDAAPAAIQWLPVVTFADAGNLFSSQLLINAAAELRCQANIGPVYLFLDQYKHIGDGGSRTVSQHNALRIQPSWGPNISGGSITQTDATYILNFAAIDATVGSASVTTLTYWSALNPSLVSGGTIGTWRGLNFDNISGPSTILGINSIMSNGTFINHTGTAPSNFGGIVRIADTVSLTLGTDGGNRVQLSRPSAGVMRMIGAGGSFNEGLDWNFNSAADRILVTSTTSARLQISLDKQSWGSTNPSGTNNWRFIWTTSADTAGIAGEWSDALITHGANLDINGLAMSVVDSWRVNPRGYTLSGGTISEVATFNINGMTTSGIGSALTAALRISGRSVHRGSVNLHPITAANLTGDVNNYTGMGTGTSQRSMLRVSTDGVAARTITGFDVAATSVRVNDTIWIVNVDATGAGSPNGDIILAHQNASSTASNRIITNTGANLTLEPNEAALLWYDDTNSRWRVLYTTGA